MNINTIIFDLGGVIVNLNEGATVEELVRLAPARAQTIEQAYKHAQFFKSYEMGLMTDEEFRTCIRELLGVDVRDQEIDTAWNAMLGDIPVERLQLMTRLRSRYNVMVLSNTNAIHVKSFNQTIQQVSGKPDLTSFADRVFFSHELNLRKPHVEIYQKVIELAGIVAHEAIFLDDKLDNLNGARQAGLRTLHIAKPDDVLNIESHVEQQ